LSAAELRIEAEDLETQDLMLEEQVEAQLEENTELQEASKGGGGGPLSDDEKTERIRAAEKTAVAAAQADVKAATEERLKQIEEEQEGVWTEIHAENMETIMTEITNSENELMEVEGQAEAAESGDGDDDAADKDHEDDYELQLAAASAEEEALDALKADTERRLAKIRSETARKVREAKQISAAGESAADKERQLVSMDKDLKYKIEVARMRMEETRVKEERDVNRAEETEIEVEELREKLAQLISDTEAIGTNAGQATEEHNSKAIAATVSAVEERVRAEMNAHQTKLDRETNATIADMEAQSAGAGSGADLSEVRAKIDTYKKTAESADLQMEAAIEDTIKFDADAEQSEEGIRAARNMLDQLQRELQKGASAAASKEMAELVETATALRDEAEAEVMLKRAAEAELSTAQAEAKEEQKQLEQAQAKIENKRASVAKQLTAFRKVTEAHWRDHYTSLEAKLKQELDEMFQARVVVNKQREAAEKALATPRAGSEQADTLRQTLTRLETELRELIGKRDTAERAEAAIAAETKTAERDLQVFLKYSLAYRERSKVIIVVPKYGLTLGCRRPRQRSTACGPPATRHTTSCRRRELHGGEPKRRKIARRWRPHRLGWRTR
jgi:hypothetical protein